MLNTTQEKKMTESKQSFVYGAYQVFELKPKQDTSISIVMPAYELEDSVEQAIKHVEEVARTLTDDYEIIVVDDGSNDGTYVRALNHRKNPHVKVLRHRCNRGKGAAIKTGVRYATKQYTILLDADMEIDPRSMRFLVNGLKSYDLVVCSKRHPKSVYRAPFVRRLLSVTFNVLVKLLLGIRFGDTQTGFKAFRTEVLRRIMDVVVVKRYAYDVEVLAVASMLRLRALEVPVRIVQRSMFRLGEALQMFLDVLGIAYRLRIKRWYQKRLRL